MSNDTPKIYTDGMPCDELIAYLKGFKKDYPVRFVVIDTGSERKLAYQIQNIFAVTDGDCPAFIIDVTTEGAQDITAEKNEAVGADG